MPPLDGQLEPFNDRATIDRRMWKVALDDVAARLAHWSILLKGFEAVEAAFPEAGHRLGPVDQGGKSDPETLYMRLAAFDPVDAQVWLNDHSPDASIPAAEDPGSAAIPRRNTRTRRPT